MLTWFRETAPIRAKFRALTYLQAALALLTTGTIVLVVEDVVTSHGATALIVLASGASVVTKAVLAPGMKKQRIHRFKLPLDESD